MKIIQYIIDFMCFNSNTTYNNKTKIPQYNFDIM